MMTIALASVFALGSAIGPVAAQSPAVEQAVPDYRLAAQLEPSFGVGSGSFFTGLVGARFDIRFTPQWSLGPYVGYANLKGPHGERVHNTLIYVLLDYQAPLLPDLTLPLRLGAGYLPKNGPYLRSSVGLGYELGDDWQMVGEVVPAFWSVENQTELSLGLALEVSRSF